MSDSESDKPFQVVVRQPVAPPSPVEAEAQFELDEEPLSLDEIEAAYLRALENAELIDDVTEEAIVEAGEFTHSSAEEEMPIWEEPVDEAGIGESVAPELKDFVSLEPEDLVTDKPVVDFLTSDDSEPRPLGTEQVLEALLFVGGEPLATKKLLDLLGGSTTAEQLDETLTRLNTRYLTEGRPYEIRLQTGGYVLQLREEFEAVRSRAFGHGPKDVKLAQDALEVLALIAYRQPASKEELEEMGRPNLGPILRQLLRRQLVSLERREEEDVARYRTTPRFLGLFGLQSLHDLPQAGDFNFR